MNVDDVSLRGADVPELRSRGELADEIKFGVAKVKIRVGIDADAVDTGPGQRGGGVVAAAAGANLGLQGGAAVTVGVGRSCAERGCAACDRIHRLACSVDSPYGAATGIGEINIAVGVNRGAEDAANTEAGSRPAFANRRLRPDRVLNACVCRENPRRIHFEDGVVVLVASVDVSTGVDRYRVGGIEGVRVGLNVLCVETVAAAISRGGSIHAIRSRSEERRVGKECRS